MAEHVEAAYRVDGRTCVAAMPDAYDWYTLGPEIPSTVFPRAVEVGFGNGRLQQRWLALEGGVPIEWSNAWDVALQIGCRFALTSDGVERCLPLSHPTAEIVYADPACSDPRAIASPDDMPRFALRDLDPSVGVYDLYRVGDPREGATLYYRLAFDGSCQEFGPLSGQYLWDVEGPLSPDVFVRGTTEVR